MSSASLQSRRVWIGGGLVAAVLIAAASWFLLISPELSAADSLHSEAAAQRNTNTQMANSVETLKQKSTHIDRYTSELERAFEELPSDTGMAQFTTQLRALAASDHVTLQSITVGAIAPALPATATTVPSSGSTSTTSNSSSTGSTTGTTTGTTSTTTTAPGSPVAGSLYAVPVTVMSNGPLHSQLAFLSQIRSAGPRFGLVSSVNFAPGAGAKVASIDGSSTMSVQVTVFSAPQTPEQLVQLKKLLSGDIGS